MAAAYPIDEDTEDSKGCVRKSSRTFFGDNEIGFLGFPVSIIREGEDLYRGNNSEYTGDKTVKDKRIAYFTVEMAPEYGQSKKYKTIRDIVLLRIDTPHFMTVLDSIIKNIRNSTKHRLLRSKDIVIDEELTPGLTEFISGTRKEILLQLTKILENIFDRVKHKFLHEGETKVKSVYKSDYEILTYICMINKYSGDKYFAGYGFPKLSHIDDDKKGFMKEEIALCNPESYIDDGIQCEETELKHKEPSYTQEYKQMYINRLLSGDLYDQFEEFIVGNKIMETPDSILSKDKYIEIVSVITPEMSYEEIYDTIYSKLRDSLGVYFTDNPTLIDQLMIMFDILLDEGDSIYAILTRQTPELTKDQYIQYIDTSLRSLNPNKFFSSRFYKDSVPIIEEGHSYPIEETMGSRKKRKTKKVKKGRKTMKKGKRRYVKKSRKSKTGKKSRK